MELVFRLMCRICCVLVSSLHFCPTLNTSENIHLIHHSDKFYETVHQIDCLLTVYIYSCTVGGNNQVHF